MHLNFALLASRPYQVTSDGPTIVGITNTYAAARFPVRVGLHIVTQIEYSNADVGDQFTFTVELIDEDGQPIAEKVLGVTTVEDVHPALGSVEIESWPVPGVLLPKPGRYEFVVRSGGEELARLPFDAVENAAIDDLARGGASHRF